MTHSKITLDNKSIFFKSYVYTGFIFVSHLLNIDGTFINFDILEHIYPNTKEYASLRTAVTTRQHTQHLPNVQNTIQYAPSIPNHILLIINTWKGCKPMYNLLLDKKEKYVHLYQNGEIGVTTIHKLLRIKFLNSHLSLHSKQNYIGYNIIYFIGLFLQINIVLI